MLAISFDGGKTWNAVVSDKQEVTQEELPAWLGFETSQTGRWISGSDSLWTTKNGGYNWIKFQLHLS